MTKNIKGKKNNGGVKATTKGKVVKSKKVIEKVDVVKGIEAMGVVETEEKKKSSTEEANKVNYALVNQAIEGVRILETKRRNLSGSKNILEEDMDDSGVYLQVAMVKVTKLLYRAKHLVRPIKIKVYMPHSLVNETTDVLLITKDDDEAKGLRADHEENLYHYQQMLRVSGASRHISEVITLKQLKVEYKEYEAKRHLANRTDVVLCDDTVVRRIPMFLGKAFYGKRKFPIPVNLKAKRLLTEIERRLKISILYLPMTGNSGYMKIGRLDQSNEMIMENIKAAVKKMEERFPGTWMNVKALYLKTEKSKAVPFYTTLRSANDIKTIYPKPISGKSTVVGEVTSCYGDEYIVTPDNNVEFYRRVSYTRNAREEAKAKRKLEEANAKGEPKQKATKRVVDSATEEEADTKLSKNDKLDELLESGEMKVASKEKTGESSKKKKKATPERKKKGKKGSLDMDSDDEELSKMEMDYLKKLITEQGEEQPEGKTKTKVQPDEVDDWAEDSDGMSEFSNDDL